MLLLELPAKILLAILGWLTPEDIFAFSLASRDAWRVCNGSALWALLLERNAHFLRVSPELSRKADAGMLSFKELYTQTWLATVADAMWRSVPRTEEREREVSSALLKALRFVRARGDVRSAQRLLRRVYKLCRALSLPVEAANALLLMAEPYEFSLHDGQQAIRRAQLTEQAVLLFGEARYWERANEVSAALRAQICTWGLGDCGAEENGDEKRRRCWKTTVERLTSIEQANALRLGVEGKARLFEQYFFVEFCAGGDLAGRRFVVKGREAEPLGNFVRMLGRRFPDARIDSSHAVAAEAEGENGQAAPLVHVHSCKPIKLDSEFALAHDLPTSSAPLKRMPPRESRKYFESTNTNTFLYSRPFLRCAPGSALSPNQFKDLHIAHNYIVTRNTFPGLGRWSEVVRVVTLEKKPLENARDAIDQKNHDLLEAIRKAHLYHQKKAANAGRTPFDMSGHHTLSMLISGVVDAAVSGGVKHYMDAFLTRHYVSEHPEQVQSVAKLLRLIEAQKAILVDALDLHRKVIDKKLLPFHENLLRCFSDWCETLEACSRNLSEVLRGTTISKLSPTPTHRNSARLPAFVIAASMARISARKSVDYTGRNALDIIQQVEDGDSLTQVIANPRHDSSTEAQMATLFTPRMIEPGVIRKLPSTSLRRKLSSFLLRSNRRGASESPSRFAPPPSSSSLATTSPQKVHHWKRGVTPPPSPLHAAALDLCTEPLRPLTFDAEDLPPATQPDPQSAALDPLLSPALTPPLLPAAVGANSGTAMWKTPQLLAETSRTPTPIALGVASSSSSSAAAASKRKLSASVLQLQPLAMSVLETSDGRRLRRVYDPEQDDDTCLFFRSFYFAEHSEPSASRSSSSSSAPHPLSSGKSPSASSLVRVRPVEREMKEIRLTMHSLEALSDSFGNNM